MPDTQMRTEPLTTGEFAYNVYGNTVDWTNFRGDRMPAFEDLPEKIRQAWENVAEALAGAPVYEDPTSESRGFRKELDGILQRLKASPRKSRSRSLAITHLEDKILRLGMDLKEQREQGIPSAQGPNPYPDSYNPNSAAPVAPTADGLNL